MHLLTTMGMGRVRMKVPASAQKPPSSLPVKVCGDLNRKIFIIQKKILTPDLTWCPTVVTVRMPHHTLSRNVHLPSSKSESLSTKKTREAKVSTATPTSTIIRPSSLYAWE